ncbi:Ankrd39 [Symbiodinium pilosum]|uniref:Ankrd39 protein n=1 Tax=Symbiodinium pilosum TaxID=2952 RepID=A0A812ITK4_SYMPI|nr:Ankrd39 [Symbiodinium pilosum]
MSSVRPLLVTESDAEGILNDTSQEPAKTDETDVVKPVPTGESDFSAAAAYRTRSMASDVSSASGVKVKKSFRRLWSIVQDRVSTFPMQQHTGDGLILAMVRTRDQMFSDTVYTEDTTHEVLQLVLVLWLHAASLILQYGLTYHLYFTTVDGLAAPFSSGITDKLQAILHALGHEPPLPLSEEDPVQKDALDLCMKQHSLGLTHLMVLSLWGARMVAEVSELLNSGTILSLIAEPAAVGFQFLEERTDDGKMLVANMSLMMKIACIVLVIIPKLVCTSFLMWTGGKMFMLTHTMGSLIIPLLTLTYILQIPAILFSGFSSFKFKEKVQLTLYQYRVALCYNSPNCQMWGLTVIKAAATFCYVFFIYVLAFGDVTEYRNLCSRYLTIFPAGRCSFRCQLGLTSPEHMHNGAS